MYITGGIMEYILQDVYDSALATDSYRTTTTYLRDESMRDRRHGLQGTLTPVDININDNTSAYKEVLWVED
tara:strand:+ start:411 stop:623 length:213 start_codon:yes stop_codon:yes gene_type:complete